MTKARLVAYLLVPAWALALLLPAAAPGAQLFLKLDGIPGESADAKHKDQIDVLAFSWGVSASNNSKTTFQDVSITKRVDQASPQLFLRAAGGQAIPVAVLSVRAAGERQDDFLTYCLTDVRVTSVSTAAGAGEDRPTEQVSLSYDTFFQSYTRQRADGSAGAAFVGGWDLSRNALLGAPSPAC